MGPSPPLPLLKVLPLSPRKVVNPRTAIRTPVPASFLPDVSIIVPARNEEASLPACLESLTAQTGVRFEIIVVDDASTDRTCEIALSFTGVQVVFPRALSKGLSANNVTGKNNAVIAGAKNACANWLLFTDADTVHLPGSLARALNEARKARADLLSYSPEQLVVGFAERAVMPVIFAELAAQYPPEKVRDPNSGIVAANGQYILVRREAYDAVGGHAAVATEILEDVALARRFREAGKRVYFRYGGDAVRTRMYRNWAQLREGWTKNLALLFPHPGRLALGSLLLWLMAWSALGVAVLGLDAQFFGQYSGQYLGQYLGWVVFAALSLVMYRRIRTAHFSTANNLIAMAFGLPMFAYLLLLSKRAHAKGRVFWKNRAYGVGAPRSVPAEVKSAGLIPGIENQKLRTGN
jgi:glycosyltransferase involved in cell wall biosynthesis